PETLTVEFTAAQRRLHDGVLGVIERILARCHGQQNVKFMMTTIRRQAASCLYGLAPTLSDILTGKLDRLELLEASDSDILKGKRPNNKALVFSTFRHTLTYLERHTRDRGLRVGLIHGNVPDDERASLRRCFALPKEDPDAIDVLLSSEVSCEGLDFQFCDLL